MPNFQNPTGNTASLERRKQVLELAYKYNVVILEDNSFGELRFNGVDLPSLKSLDTKGNVIYVGSFSKSIAPGLRVGFLLGAENIAKKAAAVAFSATGTNTFAQMLVHRFVSSEDYEDYLDNIRAIYKYKCELLLNSLKFTMPRSISFTEPEGGFYIWATLPDGDLQYFCKKLLDNGVAVMPGNFFYVDDKAPSRSFRLSFAAPDEERIEKGVELLSRISKEFYR